MHKHTFNLLLCAVVTTFGFSTLSYAGPSCPPGYSVKAKTCSISGNTVTTYKSNGYGGFVKEKEVEIGLNNEIKSTKTFGPYDSINPISHVVGGRDLVADAKADEQRRNDKKARDDEAAEKKKEKDDLQAAKDKKAEEAEDKKAEAALKKERCKQNKECGDGFSDRLTGTDAQGHNLERNVVKTKNQVKAAELTNAGLQTVGSTAVTMIGQAAQMDLQRPDAKLSDSFKAAKKATNSAITGSAVNMAANATFAVMQAKRNRLHKNLHKDLSTIDFSSNSATSPLKEQILTMARKNAGEGASTSAINREARKIQQEMLIEQNSAITAASGGTYASTILAAQQAMNVKSGTDAAKMQQLSINQAQDGENLTAQIANQPAQMITMQGGNGTPDQNAATADGTQAASTSEDSITDDAPTVGLGGPSNPFADENLGTAPTPGSFQASKAGGSNMGGGGAVSAGGGSAPSAGDQGEQKAQYVANFEGRDRYESGGTMVKGGGGAKGAPAGGGDSGLDFNSLLAQFLPKTEGEGDAAQNGILEYGGGGRSPASAAEAPSYLDKSADIFQRIHQTYQEKQGRGHVGI